jgi:hypothetical protein
MDLSPQKKKATEPKKKPIKKKTEKRPTGKRKEMIRGGRETVKTSIEQCTEKEMRFLDALFSPECDFVAYKAYQKAYPKANDSTARSKACFMYKRLLPIIRQWLDEAGLSKEHLKHKLLELINAEETKFFAHEGFVISRENVKALHIQVKALELGMKAQGMLSDKSTREVDQIDELIEIELAKLAAAGQTHVPGKAAKKNKPVKAPA